MTTSKFVMAIAAALMLHTKAYAADLTVEVTHVRNATGVITLCLWNAPDGFPDCNGRSTYQRATLPAKLGSVTFQLHSIAPGNYAISLFHDEKRVGRATTNFLGIPNVGVGASRDARGTLGPPSFAKAQFTVGAGAAQQTITMDYP